MAAFYGGCYCGAIRFEGGKPPLTVMFCHCRHCQQMSGGAAQVLVLMKRSDLKLIKGKPKSFEFKKENSTSVRRYFCEDCGGQLFGEWENRQEFCAVMAGALDDPSWLHPSTHVFCKSRQPWDWIGDDLDKVEDAPSGYGAF
jgi:hypothetical protein